MKHAVSQQLLDYWDQLRGSREAPERGEIDPAAIRAVLADTFILEVTSRAGSLQRGFPIRLAGTRLNALFLEDVKGRSIFSLFAADQRATIEEFLESVVDERAATVAGIKAAPPEAEEIDLELLLLPLRHHGHSGRRILGSLAPFRIPTWLGLRPVLGLRITSMRTVASPTVPLTRLVPPRPVGRRPQPVRRGRFMVHEGGRDSAAETTRPALRP